MKKVLFFTTSGNYFGGGVMCLVETLRYIDRTKIEPCVLLSTHGTTEDVLHELNIKTFVVRNYDWLYPTSYIGSFDFWLKRPLRWVVNLLAEKKIYRLMKQEGIEAYHLNSIYNDCGVLAANKLGILVYWHIREFVDSTPWTSTFVDEKKAYRKMAKAHKLFVVSQCVKDYYLNKMPTASIQVVYDGVDVNDNGKVRSEQCFHHPLRLSMVGGVSEVKGHADALLAVAELRKKGMDCRLTIYGRNRDKAYQQRLAQIIEGKRIRDYVCFAGNCDNMTEVWDNTDIVLVCSKSESFGRVAIEAMYHGIPVVGADNSGTKELITPDVYGNLYRTGDAKDLCDKILSLLGFNDVSKRIQKSRERALLFTSERSAESLCDALQS